DGTIRYNGTFHSTWLVEAQYGRHNEKQTYSGAGTTIPEILNQTVSPTALTGGFGYFENIDAHRDQFRADVTKFAGANTIKGGIDFQRPNTTISRFDGGGGQRIYLRTCSNATCRAASAAAGLNGLTYYRHRFYINDLAPGYDRATAATYQISNPLVSV